jgi:hypothetical protein
MKDGTDKVHRPPNIHESPDGGHASTTVNLLSNIDGPQQADCSRSATTAVLNLSVLEGNPCSSNLWICACELPTKRALPLRPANH